jgi:hypothetical protein
LSTTGFLLALGWRGACRGKCECLGNEAIIF